MSTEKDIENLKIAVALRTARAAIGINQQELADAIGIEKSTLARVETLEVQPKADVYMKALKFFKAAGVDVDAIFADGILIRISPESLLKAKSLLADENRRRSDRKVSRSSSVVVRVSPKTGLLIADSMKEEKDK